MARILNATFDSVIGQLSELYINAIFGFVEQIIRERVITRNG